MRSSIGKEKFCPPARANDGKMWIVGIKSRCHCRTIPTILNMQSGGKHLGSKHAFFKDVKKIKMAPKSTSSYNVDGEVYENDCVTLTLKPGFLNMLGKVYEYEDNVKEFLEDIKEDNLHE